MRTGSDARNFQLPARGRSNSVLKERANSVAMRNRDSKKKRERERFRNGNGRKTSREKKRERDKNSRVIGRSISKSVQRFPFRSTIPDGNYYLLTFRYDRTGY